jgi:hypothetical protein
MAAAAVGAVAGGGLIAVEASRSTMSATVAVDAACEFFESVNGPRAEQ